MRPPCCSICNQVFNFDNENSGIVYFKKRPGDIEWDEKMIEKDMTGHPPYARWFCEKHFLKAKEMEGLTVDKALPRIKEFYNLL